MDDTEKPTPKLTFRALTRHEEFADLVRLQKEIWGFAEMELLPRRMFVVAHKIGGQLLGAFDGDEMIAFLLALPGIKTDGRAYFHSQMLGVQPPYRNYGVGRTLKLMQREDALRRGVPLVEWTFDPLELKNAYFNLQKLGAVVRRFVHNQYGYSTSKLHGALPTDRLTAEWYIGSTRVEQAVAGTPEPLSLIEARIPVPNNIGELRGTNVREAKAIQARVAAEFEQHFARGLTVVGFERSERAGTYLLAQWQPDSKK